MVYHRKLECPLRKLTGLKTPNQLTPVKNWNTVFNVEVTAKVSNVSEGLSERYFMNHSTFRDQTWYGGELL